ncbi:SRPBCC family protein [uncultured Tateyamaria sp.]|uniref:SRPBCC family protein n=1 Tax=uncultured Tateyamaria sp. TaxID=455651 RepID=UPI002604C7BF|nr:SRPBCC family protein [uncultured Tateyamaria sp.]
MKQIIAISVAVTLVFSNPTFADIQRFSQNPSLQEQGNLIQMSIEIDASISDVWKLVGEEFENSKVFNVEAASTYFFEDGGPRVGSRRRTVGTDGTFIDVQIFQFSRQNHTVSWEIIDTDLAPISFGFSEYRLKSLGPEKTRLTQVSGFQMENGLMNAGMRLRFPTILKTELVGIKEFLETGRQITASTARKVRNAHKRRIAVSKNW